MTWRIERTPAFLESKAQFVKQIVDSSWEIGDDEDLAQDHLLERRDWLVLNDAIIQFEQKKIDPHHELPRAWGNDGLIPDTYYIRAGQFYVHILRNEKAAMIYEDMISRKTGSQNVAFVWEQWERLTNRLR